MTIEIVQPTPPGFAISLAGPQGPAGPPGSAGSNGTNGTNGAPGADGSQWLSGSSDPTSGQGHVGDWYVNIVSLDIFKKTDSTTWTFQVNIHGTSGATAPWSFSVADYGAVGNGQTVGDGAISSGNNLLTCSTSHKFVPEDVNSLVQIKGAGIFGSTTLSATITSYVSSSQVHISVNASVTITSALVMWAKDDTAAFQGAIDAAVAWAQANSFAAEVFIPASKGFYGIGGALVNGGSTHGNSQITLPVISTTGNKISLVIRGVVDGSGVQHWQQTVPQVSGSTLVSFGVFTSVSGQNNNISTYGNPAVIGGPSQPGGYGVAPGVFSNMSVYLQDLSILTAYSVYGLTYSAFDFSGLANAGIEGIAYGTTGTVVAGDFTSVSSFANGFSIGALMPAAGNNDNCYVRNVTIHGGYTFAFFATEHVVADTMRILYCWSAFCPVGNYYNSVGATHAIKAAQLSIEACSNVMYFIGVGSDGIGPIVDIDQLDTESGAPTFSDNTGGNGLAAALGTVKLTGLFTVANVSVAHPTGLNIINGQKPVPIVSKSADYTVNVIDKIIFVDASAGDVNIYLISAAWTPCVFTIKKIDSSTHNVNVVPISGQHIDGATSVAFNTPNASHTYAPYSNNWYEI